MYNFNTRSAIIVDYCALRFKPPQNVELPWLPLMCLQDEKTNNTLLLCTCRILEHQPVEKQYVVETRYVGERPIPSATGATIIDTTERVVERAEPGPKCPVGTGQILDQTIDNFQRRI